MTKSAAAMRIGVLFSDAPNAWALPWKARLERERRAQLLFDLLDCAYRIANRGARGEIERDRNRGELALMVDHERRDLHHRIDQRGYRHLLPAR